MMSIFPDRNKIIDVKHLASMLGITILVILAWIGILMMILLIIGGVKKAIGY